MRVAFFVAVLLLLGGCGASPRTVPHANRPPAASQRQAAVSATSAPCQKGCFVPLRQRRSWLNIIAKGLRPAAPLLLGDRLQLAPGGRSYVLAGYGQDGYDVTGSDSCATLVPSPDGRYVIYGMNAGRWLKLVLLNLRTGKRSTFRDHACGVAWGEHNEIAYIHEELPVPQGSGLPRGRVLVQHGLHGHARPWTGSGAWTGLVWAGTHLLGIDQRRDDEPFGRLVIANGPGRERGVKRMRTYSGPFLPVVAVSPSGREVLLDEQRFVKGGGEELARLVRVRDGRTLATVLLAGPPTGSGFGLGPGSWRGGHVIASSGFFYGAANPLPSLAQFTIAGHRLRLDWIRYFLQGGYEVSGDDGAGAGQPHYLTANLHQVAVWFSAGHGIELRYARCDTLTGECAASRNEQPTGINATPIDGEYISNPSRPLEP